MYDRYRHKQQVSGEFLEMFRCVGHLLDIWANLSEENEYEAGKLQQWNFSRKRKEK